MVARHRIAVDIGGGAVGERQFRQILEALDVANTDRPRAGSLSWIIDGSSAKAFGENDSRPLPAKRVMAWLAADTAPSPPSKTWR